MFAFSDILVAGMNWATVTVTDSMGKRYSLDVEAESTDDAARLFLT